MNTTYSAFDDLENDFDFQGSTATVAAPVTFEQLCPKCSGSGLYGYHSRLGAHCLPCKGTGKLTFKTSPTARAKAKAGTQRRESAKADAKAAQVVAWIEVYPAESAWLKANVEKFEYAASVYAALLKYGSLTERQLETVQRLTLKAAERLVTRAAEQATRAADAPTLSVEAIEVAFGKAKAAGIKRPKLRLDTFVFSLAPDTGVNAGAIYVKEDETYLGKVVGGRLFATRDCPKEASDRIVAVSSDPASAAVAYGKRFGSCAVCARELTDASSIERGIGPICAEKYGF